VISVLEGPCPNCDFIARRHVESEVLSYFCDRISTLKGHLHVLKTCTESPSAVSPKWRQLLDDAAVTAALSILESQIEKLTTDRDRHVKRIWKGYTKRWGPGTIGIHHGLALGEERVARADTSQTSQTPTATSTATPTATSTTHSTVRARSIDGVVEEGRMVVDWIRPDRGSDRERECESESEGRRGRGQPKRNRHG